MLHGSWVTNSHWCLLFAPFLPSRHFFFTWPTFFGAFLVASLGCGSTKKKPPELQEPRRSPHPQPMAKIGEGSLGPATGKAAPGKHGARLLHVGDSGNDLSIQIWWQMSRGTLHICEVIQHLEDKLGWFWQKPTSAALSEERVSFCGPSNTLKSWRGSYVIRAQMAARQE